MNKIKIVTDSAAAIPENILKKNNIEVVPLKVSWPEENIEGNVKSKVLFQSMRNTLFETGPKTSQPSPGDFKKVFEEHLKEYEHIICITIGTGVSGAYNSAMQAVKFLKKEKQACVTVIDSCNVDGAEGLIVLKAVELASRELKLDEIVLNLEEFKKHVEVRGFAGDPKWLEKTGRLSKAGASVVRQMEKIGIRPLLAVKEGKVTTVGLKFKAKDKVESLFREIQGQVEGKPAVFVITHSDIFESALELREKIKKELPNIEVLFLGEINPIIGCHIGPDSIICSYYLKENDV